MADASDEILELILPSRAEVSETAPVLGSAYAILFTGEDTLAISSANMVAGVTIAIHGRLYDRKRGIIPFAFDHTPFADRTIKRDTFPLGHCYLMNVTAFVRSGAPKMGQTFVQVQVQRGTGAAAYRLGTLLQGYVTQYQDLAYPGSPIQDSITTGGSIRTFTATTPAPGAEISEVVPTGARWQVLTVRVNLTTSTTPGSRECFLRFRTDGTSTIFTPLPAPASIAPGGYFFVWQHGVQSSVGQGGLWVTGMISRDHPLMAGSDIGTLTNGLQADDQWHTIRITVREWLEVS